MAFPKNSAFHSELVKLRQAEQAVKVAEVKHDLPLEHWHHDLVTVDILLEQNPPDIERARGMLRDIGHEIQRNLR